MGHRSIIATVAVAATMLGALVVTGDPAPGSSGNDVYGDTSGGRGDAIVRTESGWVRGHAEADSVTFAGIPYAAPPVGEARWAPPRRPAPWRGVRDATVPASPCAQPGESGPGTAPTVVGDEDCLYLNVTVPRSEARTHTRRPVMVWIHGGDFESGAGSDYDARVLAPAGDVVVVTINYRLGPLGYLSAPALDRGQPDGSGNYGFQDQQAALRWVKRNAARFGGHPGNVTIVGQSAGSASVCAHLSAPGSRGLFDKAIAQSGACANPFLTKDVADQRGARASAALGCASTPDAAVCLRSRPVADVLTKLPVAGTPITGRASDRPWMPVAGTPVLPEQPLDAISRGAAAGVPLLVGSMRDEMRPFVGFQFDAIGNPLTAERYRELVVETFGPDADDVLGRYPAGAYPSPALALATVLGDWGGRIGACPVLRTAQVAARHAPVFAYEMTEDSGEVFEGFPLGAFHGWDLPFVWGVPIPGTGYPPLTSEQRELSQQMMRYWTTFARTGDPNAHGLVPWPRLRPADDTVLSLAAGEGGVAPTAFSPPHQCDFWSGR
jgi:para-nitrobenzyl esterase